MFDVSAAVILLIILSPLIAAITILIKMDSKGPAMFRQTRVTQYGKRFRICKFRTMVMDAESSGTQVTIQNDTRITKSGRFLRKYRFDEVPQLLNIITGDMTFVGTRPEVVKYVERYTNEMMATLLLPAGVTSEASIRYRDEETLLMNTEYADNIYLEKVLPEKMKYNLEAIEKLRLFNDLKTMIKTITAIEKTEAIKNQG